MSWLVWDDWALTERNAGSEIDVIFKAKWRDRLLNLGARNAAIYERNIEISTPRLSAPNWQAYDGSNGDLPISEQHIWIPPGVTDVFLYARISWGTGIFHQPDSIYARLVLGTVQLHVSVLISTIWEMSASHVIFTQSSIPAAMRGTVQPYHWEARRDQVQSAILSSVNIGPASGRAPERACRLYWGVRS